MPKKVVPVEEVLEGELIDKLQVLDDEQGELNASLRESKAETEKIETELIRRLVARKVEGSRGTLCSVVIDRKTVPQMDDYDIFIAAVKRKGDFHMLERRISVTAWREFLDMQHKPYPGTTRHEKVSLHRSKLSKRS